MNKKFWDKNADSWGKAVQSQLIASRKITNPAIIGEITRRKPSSVLDLGCGEGWIASELLPKGVQYMGLDFSAQLIDVARISHPGASFEVVSYDDLARGRWKNPQAFDVAVFNFSLFENDLSPILKRTASYLNPSGIVLIQTLHPCSILNSYEDGWKMEDFKSFPIPFEGTMPWYARTLGSWIRVLTESGLVVREILEPLDRTSKTPLSIIFAASKEP